MRTPSTSSRYQSAVPRTVAGSEFYPSLYGKPAFRVVGERLHIVSKTDELRPDLIADSALGDPSLWWVIMEYNKILDPYSLLEGDNLRIPLFSLVPQGQMEPLVDVPEGAGEASTPPVPMEVASPESDSVGETGSQVYLHLYNFQVEKCLVGQVHYEIQIALDGEFRVPLMGRLSALSLERWSYLSPNGYQKWPAAGLPGVSSGRVSAYFSILVGDPLVKGGSYYARLRSVIDNEGILTYGNWFGSAFVI